MRLKYTNGQDQINKADCCVRALSNTLSLPYNSALKLAQQCGWVMGEGVDIDKFLIQLERGLGGRKWDCLFFGNHPVEHKCLITASTKHLDNLTVDEFQRMDLVRNRRILLWTKGHLSSMINGTIYDCAPVLSSTQLVGAFFLIGNEL